MTDCERLFSFDDSAEHAERLLPRIDRAVARALERALLGHELGESEALAVARARGEELSAAVAVADWLRQKKVGDLVTYVVCRNINFTNVCYVGCKFCAFSTGPGKPDAWNHSLEEVGRRAEEAWNRGATEICMQGGLPRDMSPFYYRDLLQAIRARVPKIHIHAYSPMEITYGVELTGLGLENYLSMLRAAGLDSIPGTAAEILDDEVRQVLSKNKVSVAQWIRVITAAHRLGIPTTSTMMYGHRENELHWVRHILLLRNLQKQTGGFTEFVPLGFVHHNTALYHQGLARPGPTPDEHIRVHALARILLNDTIPNIQVSWVKMGRRLSQLCLRAGANDFGGTLMEESISRLAGSTEGQMLWPYEFRNLIREIGRIPAERSTTYKILRSWPERAGGDGAAGRAKRDAGRGAEPNAAPL
ncbi:MAG TPA: 5-amino-6-(D-ribitylamino)uracil--L-tyrosine 4-hydroxyphenyl transferase CofH [Candidatus Acidoferrales bacterium]|nr:5-amino-6-(D-ribitylamino)uracil--L-tyrosine 4-hydroxyphenyl transferase CofH [Candidatus Acidoferrales bacterium]